MKGDRLHYVDHLRVLLTVLVVLHHTAITYGGEGSWYYIENTASGLTPTTAILSLFTGVNQAFFMGFFFLISGYFTPRSYERKGAAKFLKDRFIRLGIPLLAYIFVVGPSLIYALRPAPKGPFWSFYTGEVLTLRLVEWGPMWFVEGLLYMAIAYVIVRKVWSGRGTGNGSGNGNGPAAPERPFPSDKAIAWAAIVIGAASFLVRLFMPTGEAVLGLQLGYFASYVFLFVVGIVAYRNDWFHKLSTETAKRWLSVTYWTIPFLPITVVLVDVIGPPGATINGGPTWPALVYAFWEPFVAFGIIFSLARVFRDRFNATNGRLKRLSNAAYTVYIIHPPIVVGVSVLLRNVPFPGLLKFVIVGATATAICFVAATIIRKLPYADRVL